MNRPALSSCHSLLTPFAPYSLCPLEYTFSGGYEKTLLRFQEKGGNSREIPVRHDLEEYLRAYLDAGGIVAENKDWPYFRSHRGRTGQLTHNAMTSKAICELVKRRLKDAGLPNRLSPHSFSAVAVTDLLTQGGPLQDVQYLAGHTEARTAALYDQRQKRVPRNIVGSISR